MADLAKYQQEITKFNTQYAREANEAASVRSAIALSEEALGRPRAERQRQRGTQHDLVMGKELALACIDHRSK